MRKIILGTALLLGVGLVGCEDPMAPTADVDSSAQLLPDATARSYASAVSKSPDGKPNLNFVAVLSGAGAGTDSPGRGVAKFQFDESGLGFRINVSNTENVTMAHIHVSADPGGNGPPVVWLYPAGPPPQLIEGRSDGVLATGQLSGDDLGGSAAVAELIQAIVENRAYVNVHTSQFPGGEIRGQIDTGNAFK
jgi:hypothetical protein